MKTKNYRCAGAAGITLSLVFSLLLGGQPLQAASPSELLEQGIFSEETRGDIEAALKLYQQAVAETKAGQSVGAQAQYRLGVCYYKKKNYAEASAAFEKLLRDYPGEKELEARARTYLAGAAVLLPVPWVNGEELRLDIRFTAGKKLGFARYTAQAGELDGRKIWQLKSRIFAGVEQYSRVEVDAESFKPLHSRWKHTLLGDADTTFTASGAELKLAGKEGVQHIELKDVVYDNEEVVQLIRRLPLTTNYTTTLHVFTGLGGGNTIPVKTSVTGIDKIEVPAGTFECFRVVLELGVTQTFWYSTDEHHYLVKFDANAVTAELTDIARITAGAPVTWHDKGLSLTAPADWIFYAPETREPKSMLLLMDPEATAIAEVRTRSLDSLKPEAKKSVRDWAEQLVVEYSDQGKLEVRPDTWQERQAAGQPAVSFLADRASGKEPKVVYAVCTFNKNQAVYFSVEVAAKDFESYRPKFDAIVDSFRMD